MSGSDCSTSEEDFEPVLPGFTSRVADYEPMLKQHRTDGGEEAVDQKDSSIHPTPASEKVATSLTDDKEVAEITTVTEVDIEKLLWDSYSQHDLPTSELYERSFLHDSDEAGTQITHTGNEAAGPAAGAGTVAIRDVAAMTDALGGLIFSIDSKGTIRVWRKLPCGVLFMGSLGNLFHSVMPKKTCEASVGHSTDEDAQTRDVYHYFIRTDSDMQWLFFIQVVEHHDFLALSHKDNNAVPTIGIRVTLLSVNPTTLRVEYQNQARFEVPAVCMRLGDMKLHSTGEGQGTSSGVIVPQYTRQPFLLQHQHEPHLTFFTKRIPEAAHHLNGGGGDDIGVILIPCAPPRVLKTGGGGHCQVYMPAKISVANLISCCAQQRHPPASGRSGGPGASGSYPVVLVDDRGIIDYAVISEVSNTDDEVLRSYEGTAHAKLTLKIIGGLSMGRAAGPNSPDASLAKRWVNFDSRQRTNFFALLRDAQAHRKKKIAECTAEASIKVGEKPNSGEKVKDSIVTVGVMPLKVELISNGRYFVILSVRWTAVPIAAFATNNLGSTPILPKWYRIEFEQCLHIFHFATGICAGRHSQWVCAARLILGSDPQSGLVPYMDALTHQSAMELSVVDSPNAFLAPEGWTAGANTHTCPSVKFNHTPTMAPCVYLWVPEFFLPNLMGLFDEIAPDQRVTIGQKTHTMENRIYGRQVGIFQASFYRTQAMSASRSAVMARIIRLPRGIGELECAIRDAGPGTRATPEVASGLVDCELSERLLRTGTGGFHAPCVLLRRAVAPSQDLKNLLIQSHVGSRLAPEEIKRLLSAPSRPIPQPRDGDQVQSFQEEESPMASVYPLLITISFPSLVAPASSVGSCLPNEGSAFALLIYTAMVDPVIVYELKLDLADLTRTSRTEADNATPLEINLKGTSEGPQCAVQATLIDEQTSSQRIEDRWQAALLKLHRQRDFNCAELLGRQSDSNHLCSNSVEIPKHFTESSNSLLLKDTEQEETDIGKDFMKEKGVSEEPLVCDEEKEVEKLQMLLKATRPDLLLAKEHSDHAVLKNISHLQHALVHVHGYGTIYVRLLPQLAPLAVERLYRLALRGDYNKTLFHRIVPTAIVQGGHLKRNETVRENDLEGEKFSSDEDALSFPFFSHTQSFVWLCMPNIKEGTNASQFFFTVPNAPEMQSLNGCHTVLGLVVDGKELIAQISQTPLNEENGMPLTDIVIERVDVF
ncbi:unnamed protein product [Phytomonas sp. Hart1]|nr:unnamed protein product [Phytomonas sp. Hart1]|eukprot:CCW69149.1 unnamed protein product [Phytomonas sp. isolate Hart1]